MAISDKRIEGQCNSDVRIIYTIGYEGRSQDDFSKQLESNGIKRLVDVREIAQSRKPGFSSKRMSQDLPSRGIEYLHFKSLGSPKTLREELKQTGDFRKYANAYAKHLELQEEPLDTLLRNAIEKPTAIMCYERESIRCHRSIIASRLAGLGFTVIDL
jgi:uncharacterized protein (DUF488 family)